MTLTPTEGLRLERPSIRQIWRRVATFRRLRFVTTHATTCLVLGRAVHFPKASLFGHLLWSEETTLAFPLHRDVLMRNLHLIANPVRNRATALVRKSLIILKHAHKELVASNHATTITDRRLPSTDELESTRMALPLLRTATDAT
jgi:hypothetical protein